MLRRDKFFAAIRKCVFMTPEVLFLGYVVSGYGLMILRLRLLDSGHNHRVLQR